MSPFVHNNMLWFLFVQIRLALPQVEIRSITGSVWNRGSSPKIYHFVRNDLTAQVNEAFSYGKKNCKLYSC